MICPYCEKEAIWTSNEVVYGRRYGKSFMCYYCKECDAYVGCHQNSKNPLGTMANKALRVKRMEAHAVIDPLWKSGKYSRRQVYDRLSDAFGFRVHVGASDEKLCEEIIKTAKVIFK
jgi:hypothetical protein